MEKPDSTPTNGKLTTDESSSKPQKRTYTHIRIDSFIQIKHSIAELYLLLKNARFPGYSILSKDLVFIMLFTLIDIYKEWRDQRDNTL